MLISNNNEQEKEQRAIRHIVSDPLWQSDVRRMQRQNKSIIIGSKDLIYRHAQRLICPKCERGAFGHGEKGHAKCPYCGWYGRSVTVEEYLNSKLYR